MNLALHMFQKNYSSWSMRPWLLLVHANAEFQEVMHWPSDPNFRAGVRAASPTGKVPLLVDGDLVVWESLAIAEHIAERFQEARLWPEDRRARAWARCVSAEMHAGFAELRRQCPMNLAWRGAIPLDPATRRDVARFCAIVEEGRARFGAGGPYLCGRFSVADAMFAPVVTRALSYELAVSPVARAYVDAMRADPAVDRWYREAAIEREGRPAQISPITGPEVVPLVRPHEQVPARACWAVIFSSQLADDHEGYAEVAARMVALSKEQEGFLGIDSARGENGFGITVCYWDSLDAIARWREAEAHDRVKSVGQERFYTRYDLRVARVERERAFTR